MHKDNDPYKQKLLGIIASHQKAPCAATLTTLINTFSGGNIALNEALQQALATNKPPTSVWARVRGKKHHHIELDRELQEAFGEFLVIFDNPTTPISSSSPHVRSLSSPGISPERSTSTITTSSSTITNSATISSVSTISNTDSGRRSSHNSNRSVRTLLEDSVHDDPTNFAIALFLTHVGDSKTHENLIKNAMVELIDHYEKHYVAFGKSSKAFERQFHGRRLSALKQWTNTEDYLAVINIIRHPHEPTAQAAFILGINENDIANVNEHKLLLLNWLGVVYEHFYAAESPYSMIETLNTLYASFDLTTPADREHFIELIQRFRSMFLDQDSMMQVNLEHKTYAPLTQSIDELAQAQGDSAQFIERLENFKKAMITMYNELAFFTINDEQVRTQYEKLMSDTTPERAEKYRYYFDKAIKLLNDRHNAVDNPETKPGDAPLKKVPSKDTLSTDELGLLKRSPSMLSLQGPLRLLSFTHRHSSTQSTSSSNSGSHSSNRLSSDALLPAIEVHAPKTTPDL